MCHLDLSIFFMTDPMTTGRDIVKSDQCLPVGFCLSRFADQSVHWYCLQNVVQPLLHETVEHVLQLTVDVCDNLSFCNVDRVMFLSMFIPSLDVKAIEFLITETII
jgi:hypothetical protein